MEDYGTKTPNTRCSAGQPLIHRSSYSTVRITVVLLTRVPLVAVTVIV